MRNRLERFAEGVERAGADVAIDDADGTERQRQQAGLFLVAGRGVTFRMRHETKQA